MKKIGITLGDITGINVEILMSSILDLLKQGYFKTNKLIIIGRKDLFEQIIQKCNFSNQEKDYFNSINNIDWFDQNQSIPLSIDTLLGKPINEDARLLNGKLQYSYLLDSVNLLKEKKIDAVVNCPVNKNLINNYLMQVNNTSTQFTGQTEFYMKNFNKDEVIMSFIGKKFKTALLSTHLPLSDVEAYLTYDLIYRKVKIIESSLKNLFKIPKPVLRICGLNPHCGEDGLIGTFEKETLNPVIHKLKDEGVDLYGPYPADSFFNLSMKSAIYTDMGITLYHDQGTIPFKMIHLDSGVNMTLGLDFIRTSTDHGPAYDLAFQRKASYFSLLAAIKVCCQ